MRGSPGGCCVPGRLNRRLIHFALDNRMVWARLMSCGCAARRRAAGPGGHRRAPGCAGGRRGPGAAPLPRHFCNRLRFPATEFVFNPSRRVNSFTGQQSRVRRGPARWLDYLLSPRSHGNPSIPRAGCFISGDVKLDQCSHTSKPAGLPGVGLCLGSAALLCPSLFIPLLLSFSDEFTPRQPSR